MKVYVHQCDKCQLTVRAGSGSTWICGCGGRITATSVQEVWEDVNLSGVLCRECQRPVEVYRVRLHSSKICASCAIKGITDPIGSNRRGLVSPIVNMRPIVHRAIETLHQVRYKKRKPLCVVIED